MGYTRKECEHLVMAADKDGKITFAQMRRAFPDCDSLFFYDLIGDNFQVQPLSNRLDENFFDAPVALEPRSASRPVILFWEECPSDYIDGYEFKDTDTFYLSVIGEDIRYEYMSRQKDRRLAWIAAISSGLAAITSVIALLR